jgi:isoamylase
MLLMGDEVRRTQRGNNNAYCQDNELSWFDWSALEREKELFEYVKKIIRFNLSTPYFQEEALLELEKTKRYHTHCRGMAPEVGEPDLSHQSHSIAFSLTNHRYDDQLHVIINSFWEPLTFELPPLEMMEAIVG